MASLSASAVTARYISLFCLRFVGICSDIVFCLQLHGPQGGGYALLGKAGG